MSSIKKYTLLKITEFYNEVTNIYTHTLNAYTKTPVTTEAIKVPNMAKVIIAPKFEKKGFCQDEQEEYIKKRNT